MKRILSTLSQKWPEYLLEILVLIIGIYGAFALEEWNEGRKENFTKSVLVENLRDEFTSNLSQLDNILSYDSMAVSACLETLELIKSEDWPTEKELDTIFYNFDHLWTFDPSMGVLRSAISSGDIQLLRNKQLINHLFSWEDLVKDARENEDRFINHHFTTMPQFFDRIQLADSYRIYDKSIPASKYSSEYIAILKDPQFENFLSAKILWINDAKLELMDVRNSIIEILALIDKE
jgi:hypothetical protein